jgi:5-methylcytosine-specific restriction endonuclease McrA
MSVKNGIDKKCTICNKEYYIRADRAEASKYCSKECWNKRRKLNDCEYCGNKITSYHGKKYCSRECSHSAMVGDKAPTWIDGKSLERDRARFGTELKEWRKAVFKRDNYTCQHCNEKTYLHAHHIIEWAVNESKRFDIDNGITLCVQCHSKVHGRWLGKKRPKILSSYY